MTQAIRDLTGHDQHSLLSAALLQVFTMCRAAMVDPDDEQEGRLAAIEASGHLLPLGVRQRKDIDDGLQPMLRRLKLRETDVPGLWETYSYHNHRDPWPEKRDQGT